VIYQSIIDSARHVRRVFAQQIEAVKDADEADRQKEEAVK